MPTEYDIENLPVSEGVKHVLRTCPYFDVHIIDGKVCALMHFAFTVGLVINMDEHAYSHRYCYDGLLDARADLMEMVAKNDCSYDPDGPWIKCKGYNRDYRNPKLNDPF